MTLIIAKERIEYHPGLFHRDCGFVYSYAVI